MQARSGKIYDQMALEMFESIESYAQQLTEALGPRIPDGVRDPVKECREALSQLDQVLWLSRRKLKWVEDPARCLVRVLVALREIQELWVHKLKEGLIDLIEETPRTVSSWKDSPPRLQNSS
jgi:hypothetical protein